MNATEFYLRINEQPAGPFTASQIHQMILNCEAGPDTPCSPSADGEWNPLRIYFPWTASPAVVRTAAPSQEIKLTPAPIHANKFLGAFFIFCGAMGLMWLFLAKPVFDRQAVLEDAVTGSRLAPNADERRHSETLGSILSLGSFAIGVGLWISAERKTG